METTKNNKFKSEIVSLSNLNDFHFTIPTYQRPYVWGDEQLKKLLDDFYKSFTLNPNASYYISSFLTKDYQKSSELIDGQQRFTSMWLIAFAISKKCPHSEIVKFLKTNNELRLSFEIRKEVSDFLKDLLEADKTAKKVYDNSFIEEYPYLRNIAKGLVFINGYLEQIEKDALKAFGDYIYHKVLLVKNTTPDNTDLNKLFSTINSAGVQLEQTDIVKANLLKRIENKVLYGKIWEACENMNNFFERNARTAFPNSNWKNINLAKCIAFDSEVFNFEKDIATPDASANEFSIDTIQLDEIESYYPPKRHYLNEDDRDSEEVFCRSIINFGQLLLHTYRLHLKIENKDDFEGTFHVNRLISIFKNLEETEDPEEIVRFFKLLWEVRYLFDKYIIKWISDVDDKSESLELINFNINEQSYYSRTTYSKSSSLMLQSVLYFTGDYLRQYWLSSYLYYLYKNHQDQPATSDNHLCYLEKLDNIFSLNTTTTDKELSWLLMDRPDNITQDLNIESYLSSSKGTSFKHYWFQKLEYILWKNWEFEKTEEFMNFRITSKNSVEHIYPQNPENRNQHPKIDDCYLHSFGNLVLLSVAQNSEYSNKSVSVKRSMFEEKRDTYDTLKSFYVFNNTNWSITEIEDHRTQMIEKIKNYYKGVSRNI